MVQSGGDAGQGSSRSTVEVGKGVEEEMTKEVIVMENEEVQSAAVTSQSFTEASVAVAVTPQGGERTPQSLMLEEAGEGSYNMKV